MSTDDFDVSRIVPSTRDLFGAIATRRGGLALVPECDGAEGAQRLDALDVRALAHLAGGSAMRQAVTATASLPMICVAPLDDVVACQRARFDGADGVCLRDFDALAKTAQSMRMMAFAWAADPDVAATWVAKGARAVVLHAPFDVVRQAADRIPAPTLLVAHLTDPSEEHLRGLSGTVDAAIVPRDIHASIGFEALLDALDS